MPGARSVLHDNGKSLSSAATNIGTYAAENC
jgi:hypothetical protein